MSRTTLPKSFIRKFTKDWNKYRNMVIKKTTNGNLIGEVFNDGIEKRGKWDMRATFYEKDGDATEHRVCEYFNFPCANVYWRK